MNDFLTEFGAQRSESGEIHDFGDPHLELKAAQETAILVDLNQRDRLEFTGSDAAGFLNRLLSYAVTELKIGSGCRPFMLDSRGRIILSFVCLRSDANTFLIEAFTGHGETVATRIDMFHFGEDFQSRDISDEHCVMALAGPSAAALLERFGVSVPTITWNHTTATIDEIEVRVVRSERVGGPAFDLWARAKDFETIWRSLTCAGAMPCGQWAFEALRIKDGIPTFPTEFGDHCTPLDAGGSNGLTDGKGCYPGQEVIERTIAIGRPALRLVGIHSAQHIPVGSPLTAGDKTVGSVTSGTILPGNEWIGLALIKTSFSNAEAWQFGSAEIRPRPLEN